MKKYSVLLMMALTCALVFSGCSEVKGNSNAEIAETTATVKSSEENISETAEIKEITDIVYENTTADTILTALTVLTEKEQENVTSVIVETENTDSDPEEDAEQNDEQEQLAETENTDKLAEITDIKQIGAELFDKACLTTWNFIFDCPYELDYEDTYENAVRVVGKDSLADILDDYNKVFTGERPELEEKYISTQYALYCYDGGRGANIFYQNTNLELVSLEGDTAVFNAVSHYADPETYEPMEDEVHTFVIVRENDEWKVSEFTLPY